MSQKATVLAMLREGPKTSNQFFAANLPRFSARIHELKAEGYRIEKSPAERGHFTYTLAAQSSSLGCGRTAPGRAGSALTPLTQTPDGAAGQQGLAASSLPGGGSIETSTADRPISEQHGNRSATEPAGLILAGGEAGNSEIRSVETASFPQASLFTLPDRSYEDAA